MVNLDVGKRSRSKGGLVTLSTIVGLVIALGVTLFGTGSANHAVASFDASAWLFSSNKGEVARVNGVTGRVDTRTKITDAQGHTMQVSQSDRYVILRDVNSGKVSVLDLSSLTIGATTESTPGIGVTVAVHNDVAFVIDQLQGLVRQLDPATLLPMGQALSFPPGIGGGTFDADGRLWLTVASEGTVVAVRPAPVPSARPGTGGQAGGTAPDPSVVKTVDVADPNHDLELSILDNGVAVLDKTATVLTTLRGDALKKVTLALTGPGELPDRTVGDDVPVTVADDRHVYVVDGDKVSEFTVPGDSPDLAPCVAWSGRLYCADNATGTVYVLDRTGKLVDSFTLPNGGKELELEVREDHLFINAPGGQTAVVVDGKSQRKTVDKYVNNVPGGDPPPVPPAPPPPKPLVGPPGAPAKVSATPGNASARVTWSAAPPNGAAIMKYVVEGDGQTREVGANQRSLDITGLTNGTEYRFSVHAVNAKGKGPKRTANPVTPTSEVPDPPASVAATANPDGTVTVNWPAANGQGRRIVRYTVTAVSTGEPKTFESAQPTLVVRAGELPYGAQVAFRVVSVNDIGASSAQSPLSPTVVPFNKPAAPTNLTVRATTNKRGTVTATWRVPEDNGAPITGYQVTVNGTRQTLGTATSAEFGGFGDGARVDVSVQAVNRAGPGAAVAGSAATLRQPTMTLQTSTGNQFNAITVRFSATDGGGTPATCTLQVAGAGSASNNCAGGSLTVNGLWPGNTYNYTVTVTNAAGMSANANGSLGTPAYQGTVICEDNNYCGRGANGGGIWVYRVPRQQDGQAVDDVFAPSTYEAVCKVSGGNVNATPWGGKNSAWWVKIKFPAGQQNYIPYAWFRLESGDSLSPLPSC
jgi:hypothetical protein